MGINDFLPRVLASVGRSCDLREYAEGITERLEVRRDKENNKDVYSNKRRRRRRRHLRVGIDVSSWIYRAAYGHGGMLADERHLTNYGRASLLQEQENSSKQSSNMSEVPDASRQGSGNQEPSSEMVEAYVIACTKKVVSRIQELRISAKVDILVVLDGRSPPIKANEVASRRNQRLEHERLRDQPVDPNDSPSRTNEKRTKANRRAGPGKYYSKIVTELIKVLAIGEIPFMVAPYEADSQLAYLSDRRYIDLVISEDSDLVAHSAKVILYKFGVSGDKSLGENSASVGKLLKIDDIGAVQDNKLDLMDFTSVMMAILFVAVGCDYCDNLKGIGLVKASQIIRKAFLCTNNGIDSSRDKMTSRISRVFEGIYDQCYLNSTTLAPLKVSYEEKFLAALFMYRHPIVYDPVEQKCLYVSRSHDRERNAQMFSLEKTLKTPGEGTEEESTLASSLVIDEDNKEIRGTNSSFVVVPDHELMDHEPYVQLCKSIDQIEKIVGILEKPEQATLSAQGIPKVQRATAEAIGRITTKESEETQLSNSAALEDAKGTAAAFNNDKDNESQQGTVDVLATQEEVPRQGTMLEQRLESIINEERGKLADQVADEGMVESSEGLATQPDALSTAVCHSQESYSRGTTSHSQVSSREQSAYSQNLLLSSSTPDKSQRTSSQNTAGTSSAVSARSNKSPLLLYSTSPDEQLTTKANT